MTCLWERMSNTDTTPSFSPAVAIKFVSAVLLMSILDTPALCSYLVKMGVPLLMSHQVTVPLRSPDTHRLWFHSNSKTASLWPLKRPYAHSNVSRVQTSKEESYPDEIATLRLSTWTLLIEPL